MNVGVATKQEVERPKWKAKQMSLKSLRNIIIIIFFIII